MHVKLLSKSNILEKNKSIMSKNMPNTHKNSKLQKKAYNTKAKKRNKENTWNGIKGQRVKE